MVGYVYCALTGNAGMVRRSGSATDPSRPPLEFSNEGRALASRATEFRLSCLRMLTADWTEEDRRTLASLLGRFAAAVQELPHPHSLSNKET